MMKNKFIFLAAAVSMMAAAACTREDRVNVEVASDRSPVAFGTYASRNVNTKAGAEGLMDDALLKSSGFGVFGYFSDASAGETAYSKTTSLPNFMYNQEVTFSSSKWTYSPVRYWPNEHGSAAASENVDKVSFLAYAPYVAAGAGTEGITALSANDAAGDAKVSYTVADKPEDNVDLVWAVAPENISWATANGGTVSIVKGMPYLNLVKPKTTQSISFLFKHATSKLSFKVLGAFDDLTGGEKDANTKITIKSVTVKGSFARSGVLNLNNVAADVALWEDKVYDDAVNSTSVIVVDKDHNLASAFIDAGDVAFASQPDGVTQTEANLLTDNVQFNLIPGTISEVVIDYFVTTDDAKLKKTYSRVENVIKYTFDTPLTIQNNKAYTLKLQLGMTTVKVTSSVDEWEDGGTTIIDLPKNVAGE